MSIFKKSDGVDVLDLTRLQKKGLFKVSETNVEPSVKVNSAGYVDLGISVLPASPSVSSEPPSEAVPEYHSNSDAGGLGFLDAFAQSASVPASSMQNAVNDNLEIQGLKNKIEDLEYKLRVLEDKISRFGN